MLEVQAFEVPRQFAAVGETFGSGFFEAAPHQGDHRGGRSRPDFDQRAWLGVQHLVKHRRNLPTFEGAAVGQKFVSHDAERKNVGARIDGIPPHLFG